MNAKEFLATRIIPDFEKTLINTLLSVYKGEATHDLLTPRNAEVALVLLGQLEDYKVNHNDYTDEIKFGSKRYEGMLKLLPDNEWDDPEMYNLLRYIYGDEKAVYVRIAWKKFPRLTYQKGYYRRSFRSPGKKELYLPNQLNFLLNTVFQVFHKEYNVQYSHIAYDTTIREQIIWDHQQSSYCLYYIWAAALDDGNEEVYKLLEDIVYNKEETGKVTHNIIKALLMSEREDCWQLVEKLLIAAQRQEGLRQSIVESIDTSTIGAFRHMLKVITDNKLARFAAVIRAIDVWAGVSWEAEKESAINAFLNKACTYMFDTTQIPEGIKSKNNADVYMALWAQGVYDVEQTLPYLQELMQVKNEEKRLIAVKFAIEAGHFQLDLPVIMAGLEDESLAVNGLTVTMLIQRMYYNAKYYDTYYPGLFDKLHQLLQRTEVKEKSYNGIAFSWLNVSYSRSNVLSAMLSLVLENQERLDIVLSYYEEMALDVKETLARLMLPGYAEYYWDYSKPRNPITEFQRTFSMRMLKEKGEFLQKSAFNVLDTLQLNEEENNVLIELLKRKSSSMRGRSIAILVNQSDALLLQAVTALLQGDAEQRLAGLDIARQCKQSDRLNTEIQPLLDAFKDRKNISTKEEILLKELTSENGTIVYNEENGYGLYDPAQIQEPVKPVVDEQDYYSKCIAIQPFGFTQSVTHIQQEIKKLIDLFLANEDHEYEVETYDGAKYKMLLGNTFRSKYYRLPEGITPAEQYAAYPLPDVWKQWFEASGLHARDLFLLDGIALLQHYHYGFNQADPFVFEYIPKMNDYLPTDITKEVRTGKLHLITNAISALRLIFPYTEMFEYLIGANSRLFANIPEDRLTKGRYNYGWQSEQSLNWFLQKMYVSQLPDHLVGAVWQLYHWRQFSGLKENIPVSIPPLDLFCKAFSLGIISESEMYRGIISRSVIRDLSTSRRNTVQRDYFTRYPFLEGMYLRVREHFLDIELKRGDSATPVSSFVAEIERLEGTHRFAQILAGLGKDSLHKGYIYTADHKSKQQLFSSLLKRCYPVTTDTQAQFDAAMQAIGVKEERLIEAAVYAPQWQKLVSGYLNWKGLDTAIWWLHVHTKSDAYSARNADFESAVALYTAIDLQDFKDGAVDKGWFQQAYKEIGKERWQKVYNAAKYISDGNGHRRARLYADVITGDLKIKEVTQKVKEKRDQDYLRMYGLIPLSKANPQKDILGRYEYLQQFKKESRQFGAQKQTSEGIAIRIAMENLARNAGYADPMRLSWAMETKQVQNILSKETQVQYDDVLIGLIIEADGEADVVAFKGDKKLAAIPAKYKKDKKVLELNEFKKTLKEQFRRSRKSLEEAMVRGDAFEAEELANLFTHPVIAKHLEKLVFVTDKGDGFWQHNTLVSAAKKITKIAADDKIRIAHCADLYANATWSDYQHYCFEHQLQQPFKQIFRELYTPLAEELEEQSISRRYAGHQVQPAKTVALLKSRGWKVDHEEGLQKAFHQEGFVVKMYAEANWFSPAEVESPVLEQVIFHDLKTYKNVAFKDINPRIFSEVMRDIDLVVSVAHVGGVDPEASHSTIEMRAVLLKETARLFKLDNVSVVGNHAKIKGQYGDYSVHLGSAIVHMMPGRYLSILPVHSQQRGRLFLPFADDDPKSAEVMSKVLLLARDKEIQDPTIIQQLTF
ncbi:DUF4132 domain-containing protein [Chitinophaga sancti]|uniref:DUF4132 domain-containing protein n=1 Tax=Chitinophaga sancti TaxID=1004 RepID=A0A1K1S0W7_9BACT|nr:DUF4132 domain-containing protein [Chitinophaga sancti]WQD59746.1 DUF4132 domain-containing protein [Chitinophaga sancti]WQG88123.1 DUF4132 domain-containing protein [Chitinophaga sancti]SFW77995.1 protein of unknown function [Chitinophaga sancti]